LFTTGPLPAMRHLARHGQARTFVRTRPARAPPVDLEW
jgi:hypothetical protein